MERNKVSDSLPSVFRQIAERASERCTEADRAAIHAVVAGEYGDRATIDELHAAGWSFAYERVERQCIDGPAMVPAIVARRGDQCGAYTLHRITKTARPAVVAFILAQ